jgi:hypothetical protein
MLLIEIPDNNIPERKYIINVLFHEFLGLNYDLSIHNGISDYTIKFDNCRITIRDDFFDRFDEPLSYLNYSNLPINVIYLKNEFTIEDDIPVVYGSDFFKRTENHIDCGIDIFASSFFMLTRWEEYVNKTRDYHNRFAGTKSIAYKYNFLNRPIVNEYLEMLWNMMLSLGFTQKRKQRNYEIKLTHDIDMLKFPKSFRMIVGDILKRKNPRLALNHFSFMFLKNPFDTFDLLMTSSEKIGLRSHFYFLSSDKSIQPYEFRYDIKSKFFKGKITEIVRRGHIIGFHPGYYTYENEERWLIEKNMLEDAVNMNITEGRQHYLRFDITKTPQIWDRNNMKLDSTIGYPEKEGFRCGTGDVFPLFDILKRVQMNLNESPLIIMDGTLFEYQNKSYKDSFEIFKYYIMICKKYNSCITLLFHNDIFIDKWSGNGALLYSKVINQINTV